MTTRIAVQVGGPRYVTVEDGVRLAVHDVGEGPPVLLVPGLGYAAWSFTDLARELARDHRVVVLDNRGTGRSDTPADGYSMARLGRDVVEVVDELDLGPTHLLGTSMGGYVALSAARAAPTHVASLILVATSMGGPAATPVPPETVTAWTAASGLPPDEYARRTMPLSFRPGWTDEHPDRFREQLAARLEHPTPMRAWSAQFAACEQFLAEGIARDDVQHPTLVVHGTEDRVVPYANAELSHARLADSRLVTMPGAGHLCWIEDPTAVADAVRAHVAGVGAATAAP